MLIQQGSAPSFTIGELYGSPFPDLAITYQISVNGGALTSGGGTVSWFSPGGPYQIIFVTMSSSDTATLGNLTLVFNDSSSYPVATSVMQVVPYDPINGGPSVNVTSWDGTAISSSTPQVDLLSTTETNIANAILDQTDAIDVGYTMRDVLKLLNAAMAGPLALSGTTITIQNPPATKDRIICTIDSMGQRSSYTYDLS